MYYSGGKQDATGELRPSLNLRSCITLKQERVYETTDAREATTWAQWMNMRDHIWGKASAAAQNVDRNMMVYDLDDVMRSVFESCIFAGEQQSTIQYMTDKCLSILTKKWTYSFTPPPATSTMPVSLTPIFTTTKHEIPNIFM